MPDGPTHGRTKPLIELLFATKTPHPLEAVAVLFLRTKFTITPKANRSGEKRRVQSGKNIVMIQLTISFKLLNRNKPAKKPEFF